MPRGNRKSVEVKIAGIETIKMQYQEKIDKYKALILELDAQVNDLQKLQRQKDVEKLYYAIMDSGKTTDEFIQQLTQ